MDLLEANKLVSSTKRWSLQNFITLLRSYLYTEEKEGAIGQIPEEHHNLSQWDLSHSHL